MEDRGGEKTVLSLLCPAASQELARRPRSLNENMERSQPTSSLKADNIEAAYFTSYVV